MSRALLFAAALVACFALCCPCVSAADIAWLQASVSQSWASRGDAAAAVCNNTLYLAGGIGSVGTPVRYRDVQRLSAGSGAWTQDTDAAPWTPREQAQMVTISATQMMLMGGEEGLNEINRLNDVWLADCSAIGSPLQWTQLPNANWSARDGFAALVWRDKLWVFGGVAVSLTNDVWSLPLSGDLTSTAWVAETSAEWSPRQLFGAVVFEDAMYVIGGSDQSGYLNDVWRKSDPAGSWMQLASAPCSPRHNFPIGVALHRIVIVGGTSSLGELSDSCSFNGSAWQNDSAPATGGGVSSVAMMPSWQGWLWWLGSPDFITASSASNATRSWAIALSGSSSSTAGQASSGLNAASSTGNGCTSATCSAHAGRSGLSVGWTQAVVLIATICAATI